MPYQLSWYVENRVIYQRLYGILTIEDLHQSTQDFKEAYLNHDSSRLHMIMDLSEMDKSALSLKELVTTLRRNHVGVPGWLLLVAPNPTTIVFANMIGQFGGRRFRLFMTLDEALEFLKKNDPSVKMGG